MLSPLVEGDSWTTDCQFWYGNTPIDWSPDGRWLMVGSPEGPDGGLTLRRSTRNPAPSPCWPAEAERSCQLRGDWAPDSKRYVYARYFERSVTDRFSIVDIESGVVSEVVDPSGSVIDPVWSPDGRWIALRVDRRWPHRVAS